MNARGLPVMGERVDSFRKAGGRSISRDAGRIALLALGLSALTAAACGRGDPDPLLPGNKYFCYPSEATVCVERQNSDQEQDLADDLCYMKCISDGGIPSQCSNETASVLVGEDCDPDAAGWQGVGSLPPDTGTFVCMGPVQYRLMMDGVWQPASDYNYSTVCMVEGASLDEVYEACVEQCEDFMFTTQEPDPQNFEQLDECTELQPAFLESADDCMEMEAQEPAPPPQLVWNVGGGTATLPLACNLNSDCCAPFGPAVCDAIAAKKVPTATLAATTRPITANLGLSSAGSNSSMTVAGNVAYTRLPCNNPYGTCPAYIERMTLTGKGPVSGKFVHTTGGSTSFQAANVKISLRRPLLAAVHMPTGQLQIPADAFLIDVSANVVVEGVSQAMTTPWLHPEVVKGTLGTSSMTLAGTSALGPNMTMSLSLTTK